MSEMSGGGAVTKYFTPASANRALVLVRRIVDELVAGYRELLAQRDALEADQHRLPEEEGARRFGALQDMADRLNALHDELLAVGCQLKDWQSGLLDFPARLDGRDVLLCWRLGEAAVTHWHEIDAGFRGRRPIAEGFAAALSATRADES